ncbi:hypothetical protein EB796_002948 [Bugula neritina]|uniref:Uncharacterized protein n=1 Tax=Bugula neritina TaxID=10212 RepID=A0A7J7KKF3_BUGNE|nr:hypothetical protein EB796_002948 [Bugula neritina]
MMSLYKCLENKGIDELLSTVVTDNPLVYHWHPVPDDDFFPGYASQEVYNATKRNPNLPVPLPVGTPTWPLFNVSADTVMEFNSAGLKVIATPEKDRLLNLTETLLLQELLKSMLIKLLSLVLRQRNQSLMKMSLGRHLWHHGMGLDRTLMSS